MTALAAMDSIMSVPLDDRSAKAIIDIVVDGLIDPENKGEGIGYVMSAGGKYGRHGYATCRWIREQLNDDASIEVWCGRDEIPEDWGIEGVTHRQSVSVKGGWPLKARAVRESAFREVVFLDADCLPMRKASELVHCGPYLLTGALFFPDIADCRKSDWAFPALGLKLGSVPEMEAGQFLINRVRHGRAIELVDYFNQRPEFFYRHMHGDKDLWALAFARLGIAFGVGNPCENKEWGLRHFMPDGVHGFDHLIHTKGGKEYPDNAAVIAGYLEEYAGRDLPL